MTESLDTFLTRAENPFKPLHLGDLTVGWVAPYSEMTSEDYNEWLVTDGNMVFRLVSSWFQVRCKEIGLEAHTRLMLVMSYEADLMMHVPVGSLDFQDNGLVVDYTERTVQHLLAALTNFVAALKNDVQSQFNNKDLGDAEKMFADLVTCYYPYTGDLTWRGQDTRSLWPYRRA